MDITISTVDLRYALNSALRETFVGRGSVIASISKDDAKSPNPRTSPGFKALIKGILYSRKFIISYQVILIVILSGIAIVHWITKIKRRQRARDKSCLHQGSRLDSDAKEGPQQTGREITEDDSSSSSSSTLRGTVSPSGAARFHGKIDEETSLLHNLSDTNGTINKRIGFMKATNSWLMYQPRPIPIIKKVLPSNATTLIILALYAINIFYTIYKVPFTIPLLFIFADRTALVFVANLPWLYLLSAKNQPIKLLTGYSYESLSIIHRRLGEIMCLLALIHSIGMIGVWYTLLRPVGLGLARFLLSKIILLGIGALFCYESLYISSLRSFRQRWYELFLGLHVTLQAAALILLWFHHHTARVYVGIALAIFLLDRLVYRMTIKTKTFRARVGVEDDKETVSIRTTIPISTDRRILRSFLGSNLSNGWKATDHVFLTIPALSRKHIIQAHPFTIASKAPTSGASEAELELIIRAQDGFSADLLRYAKGHDTVAVRLDGPYGSQNAVEMLQDSDISVVIAGGSGVAVAWPLLWSLLDTERMEDLEQQDGKRRSKQILFIWVVHKLSHLYWIGEEKVGELTARGVDVVLPPPTSEGGRPDVAGMAAPLIEFRSRTVYSGKGKIGVVCSGPDGMNRDIRNMCSGLLREGRDVNIEVEKFG